jgi:hypothetical protein
LLLPADFEHKLRAALDRYSVGNQLIGFGLFGVQPAGINAIGFEGEGTLDGERGGPPIAVLKLPVVLLSSASSPKTVLLLVKQPS